MSKTIIQALIDKDNDYSLLEDNYANSTGCALLNPDPDELPRLLSEKPLTVSIIIPARNASASILTCLSAIEQSSFNLLHQDGLEVVVVDDGSTDNTWELVKQANFFLNITMVKQSHLGCSHARNAGVSAAKNNIIIFCDSDIVLYYNTIEHFVARHQLLPNAILVGFRTNINKTDNYADFRFIRKHGSPRGTCFFKDDRITFFAPGWPNNMCLVSNHFKKFGFAKNLWMPDKDAWTLPDMVFGALFSMPRDIYSCIGGSDERFYGWGCEDAYLAANAIALGQHIVPVYAASGLHIDHPPRTRNKELEYTRNRRQYLKFLKTHTVGGNINWLPKAKKRIIETCKKVPTRDTSILTEKLEPVSRKVETFSNKVDSLLATGKYEQALSQLDTKTAVLGGRGILFKQGEALLGLHRYSEAIDILEQSLNLGAPKEAAITLLYAQSADGQFYAAHNTLKSFLEHPFARALSYWNNWTAQEHIEQGVRNKKQKFIAVAIRCFEIALAKDPGNKQAQTYRNECIKDVE